MLMYAQFVGEWNPRHGDYRWQRLPSGDHSAIGDCRATLALIHKMAVSGRIGVGPGTDLPEEDLAW